MTISGQRVLGRIIAAVLVWLTSSIPSAAATLTLDVSQFAHASWTVGNGFAKGAIYSIAQTPDGYLWLGTEFGLLRFDGVTTTPWPPDRPIANEVPSLIAARDGTLWIGMAGGLASWKDGHLTRYAELSPGRIRSLLEDRSGAVWTIAPIPNKRLCAVRNGSVKCMAENSRVRPTRDFDARGPERQPVVRRVRVALAMESRAAHFLSTRNRSKHSGAG
jgi:ligand-binding sensor domain-containing protein